MIDQNVLEEKARKYIVCFDGQCPLHEHCLRWQAGQHVPATYFSVNSVNPRYAHAAGSECIAYRSDVPQRVAVGMVHFYEAMPGAMERTIKGRLIERYSRVVYYHDRRGDLFITSDVEQEIARICRECGWTEPLQFDGYSEELVW